DGHRRDRRAVRAPRLARGAGGGELPVDGVSTAQERADLEPPRSRRDRAGGALMTRARGDGRHFEPELLARAERGEDGTVALFAPRPGLWRGAPAEGSLVRPGDAIGELEVLGLLYRLRAPAEAFGVVGAL